MGLLSKGKKGPFGHEASIKKALAALALLVGIGGLIFGIRTVKNLIFPNNPGNISNNQIKAIKLAGEWFKENSAVEPDSISFVSLDVIDDYGRYTDSSVIEYGFRIAMLDDVRQIVLDNADRREWSLAEIEGAESALRHEGNVKSADILHEESKWIRLMLVDSVLFANEFDKAYTEERARLEEAIKGPGYILRVIIISGTESGKPQRNVYLFLFDSEFKSTRLLNIVNINPEDSPADSRQDVLEKLD